MTVRAAGWKVNQSRCPRRAAALGTAAPSVRDGFLNGCRIVRHAIANGAEFRHVAVHDVAGRCGGGNALMFDGFEPKRTARLERKQRELQHTQRSHVAARFGRTDARPRWGAVFF
jgi:hypothetical protein